jgi:hypothetical protein
MSGAMNAANGYTPLRGFPSPKVTMEFSGSAFWPDGIIACGAVLLWASTVTAKHNRRKFYLGIADKLDALRRALPREREIDNKFAAFLANAAREIREDTDTVARRLSGESDMLGFPAPSDLKLIRRAS